MKSEIVEARLISVAGLQKYLGIGRSTAYKLCRQPDFPKIMFGTKVLIDLEELDGWIIKYKSRNKKQNNRSNRIPDMIVWEDDRLNYDYFIIHQDDWKGGIIYKNSEDKIVDDDLDILKFCWFIRNIKKVKTEYKRFILYRYHNEFNIIEYQDFPDRRSGLLKYFYEKYPNNVYDIMW